MMMILKTVAPRSQHSRKQNTLSIGSCSFIVSFIVSGVRQLYQIFHFTERLHAMKIKQNFMAVITSRLMVTFDSCTFSTPCT